MTTTGSRNRLTHTEYTNLVYFLRTQDLRNKQYNEVDKVARSFIGKPLTSTTLREILTTYNIEYKSSPKQPTTQSISDAEWKASVIDKLDQLIALWAPK